MDVISVDNISLKWQTLKYTREFTVERNPLDVTSVDNTWSFTNGTDRD